MRGESSGGIAAHDSLAPEALLPLLRGRFGHPYRYLPSCESTQRELPPDAPEGAVVATDEQTAGRGRLGRRWVAPAGTSLLFSINLRPEVEPRRLPELTLVAAHASADAIRDVTGVAAAIKLPNDLLVRRRKLAGILAEARAALGEDAFAAAWAAGQALTLDEAIAEALHPNPEGAESDSDSRIPQPC